jgi:hypothetical protein
MCDIVTPSTFNHVACEEKLIYDSTSSSNDSTNVINASVGSSSGSATVSESSSESSSIKFDAKSVEEYFEDEVVVVVKRNENEEAVIDKAIRLVKTPIKKTLKNINDKILSFNPQKPQQKNEEEEEEELSVISPLMILNNEQELNNNKNNLIEQFVKIENEENCNKNIYKKKMIQNDKNSSKSSIHEKISLKKAKNSELNKKNYIIIIILLIVNLLNYIDRFSIAGDHHYLFNSFVFFLKLNSLFFLRCFNSNSRLF